MSGECNICGVWGCIESKHHCSNCYYYKAMTKRKGMCLFGLNLLKIWDTKADEDIEISPTVNKYFQCKYYTRIMSGGK